MIYENMKNVIFKVLSSVVYCMINNFVCTAYVFRTQTKIRVVNKIFQNTTYNDISGIGITGIFVG